MRFRRHKSGEQLWKSLFPGNPPMIMYYCKAGDWQFVINYDTLHNVWSATYQPIHPANDRVTSTHCENPREGEKFRHYETQSEAEKACERKYRQLRANN